MVEIPNRIQIQATIRRGSVYYFEEDSFDSNEPHYFVVLNNNPNSDRILLLACASSQIQKSKNRRKKLPQETLVEVSPSAYRYFKFNTIFDCNSITERSIQDLVDKLANGRLRICTEEMSNDIVDMLTAGALLSPLVKRGNKKILER